MAHCTCSIRFSTPGARTTTGGLPGVLRNVLINREGTREIVVINLRETMDISTIHLGEL